VIIRILGEGQFDVPDTRADELNRLDERLLDAVESGDSTALAPALHELRAAAAQWGVPLPDTALVASELVVPAVHSTLADVCALLGADGLIPG